MDDSDRLSSFLRRARSRALVERSLRAGGYAVAGLVALLLALALVAALAGPAASWPYIGVGAIVVVLAAGLVLGYVWPARVLESPEAVARLVGAHKPELASDLLSAVELRRTSPDDNHGSPEMTQAFCTAVADSTQPLVVEELFPLSPAVRAMFVATVATFVLLLAVVIFPRVIGRGMRTLFHTPTLFEGALVARNPLVGDVRVTYDFPAYTGLPRQIIDGSTGDLHAVRGTRATIDMRPLRSARQARLLMGDSGEAGVKPALLDHGKLSASLVLDESGAYRVWLQPFLGRPLREDRAHRIVVENDLPPDVDIVGPADRLELETLRPVEVAYHARDDFGLADIALVYRVNGGAEQRIILKNGQGKREVRASVTFEPAGALLSPGSQVAYHVEAKDRDEVSGAKVGASRTLYLTIRNPRQGLEERLARQHEVLERLIGSLGDRIEFEHSSTSDTTNERLPRLHEIHDTEQAHMSELGQMIEQHRLDRGNGKTGGSPLGTSAARLARLLRDEQDMLTALSGKAERAGGVTAVWARLHAMGPRHIAEMENLVLALDDLIGRQRLDDLASIGQELVSVHKKLQDLLERYKATGDEQLRRQIEREVRELRARIAELAQKIAEVKARNEVSSEWSNLPDTRKVLAEAARLDDLLAKGDAHSLDQALSELGQSLGSLQEMLDKNASDFGSARFPQESRALAELGRKLGDLEGDQRQLADDGRSLAKEVDAELARRVDAQQAEFLAKAKQKLDQIQRKMSGPTPRELGSSAESASQSVREDVRQLRRLLPDKEWSEAQREADQMVAGLSHLQRVSSRQLLQNRTPSQGLAAFDDQLDDAAEVARELAADLAKIVPRGSEVMSAEQRARGQNLGQRQGSVAERARSLSHEMSSRDDVVPGAQGAANELEEIVDQMRQAGEDLQQGQAHEGAGRAREVADRLAKLRQSLGQKPSTGARASREPVRIPDADAYKAPREWRQELMEAMREKVPEKYRDEVRRYYEDLVK